jgi:hypothetical protein
MNLYMQRWDNPRPDTTIESIWFARARPKKCRLCWVSRLANEAQNLVAGDFAKVAPFNIRMKNFDVQVENRRPAARLVNQRLAQHHSGRSLHRQGAINRANRCGLA